MAQRARIDKGEPMPVQIPPDSRPLPNPGGTEWHSPTFQEQFYHLVAAYGGLLDIFITLGIALLVRRKWTGIAWLCILAALDLAALVALPGTVPENAGRVAHAIIYAGIYFLVRWLRWREYKAEDWGYLVVPYHLGALATFGKLTFFNGYVYNWWNWIIAIGVNGFLAEFWPIYWLILRPLFGH